MSIALMTHKVTWLKRNLPNGLASNLSNQLSEYVNNNCKHQSLPKAVQTTLELEILYCVMRNRIWLKSDVFIEVVTEYIVSQFGLPGDNVRSIIEDFSRFFLNLCSDDQPLDTQDIAFLRHLIVTASSGLNHFQQESGFGHTLYEKIVANQKLVLDELDDPENTKAHFLSEIDQQICSEIIEICEMDPIDTDKLMLRHELLAHGTPDRLDEIYEIMTEACKQGGLKAAPTEARKDMMAALESIDILQRSRNLLVPTSKAFKLTARGFAHSFWSQEDPEFFTVSELNPTYQHAIIKHVPIAATQDLAERIKPILDRMSPSVHLALIEVLPERDAVPLLTDVVTSAKSDWHRHFACQALAKISHKNHEVRQILHKVAQSDGSELVKDTAFEHLARSAALEHTGTNTDS